MPFVGHHTNKQFILCKILKCNQLLFYLDCLWSLCLYCSNSRFLFEVTSVTALTLCLKMSMCVCCTYTVQMHEAKVELSVVLIHFKGLLFSVCINIYIIFAILPPADSILISTRLVYMCCVTWIFIWITWQKCCSICFKEQLYVKCWALVYVYT